MRIALSVEALSPHLSGIGRYCWELSQRLPTAPGIETVRFRRAGRWIDDPAALLAPDFAYPRAAKSWLPRRLRSRLDRPALEACLFHGPNYFLPPEAGSGIITVHDLSVMRFPETHPEDRIRQFNREFDASLARAAHILTDTETVRAEVIADLGIAPDRVTAVHLGVDPAFRPMIAEQTAAVRAPLGLAHGGYGLCVSALEPRKRIGELIAAWGALPRGLRDSTPLVLAGPKGWLNDSLMAQIARGQSEGWLIHAGFVAEADLPALYAGAALFAYPSIYEGFGLPPLEAMASGVPVIVSDQSCLPEVTGGAAATINPDDAPALREAIQRGLEDLPWRTRAISAGLTRAQHFSWERCAAETVHVYQKVWQAAGPMRKG